MANSNALLAVAALLAGAAYLFAEEPANAGTTDGDTNVSNGFGINNPLNIRYISGSNAFNGQIGNHGGYGQYDKLENGVRAAGLELDKYNRGGLDTITKVVSTWAPSSENDTAAYIADVSQRMQNDANEPLAWPEDKVSLLQAMAWHENGFNNMSDEFVQAQMVT